MRIIDETLRNERPRLQELLKDRLLAILTLAPEPLTLSQIVFACNQVQPPAEFWPSKHRHMPSCYDNPSWKQASRPRFSKDDLECLLQLLYNLFPPRGLSIDEQPQPLFAPYHKSVADWFKCEAGMNSGEYQVDKRWGERLLREAGFSLGESPLIIAAKKGKDGALEVLLRAGCNPNVKDEVSSSVLHYMSACLMMDVSSVAYLRDDGAPSGGLLRWRRRQWPRCWWTQEQILMQRLM